VHTKRIGNLAAVMDIMLKDVPDNPSAGVGVDLAFPLVLNVRLQIREGIPPHDLLHDLPGLLQAADQFVRGTLGISRFIPGVKGPEVLITLLQDIMEPCGPHRDNVARQLIN